MIQTSDIQRPDPAIIERLWHVSAATAAGMLHGLGIRNPHLQGPVAWTPGRKVVGSALTLQFMPKREDLYNESEYSDPERQLHRHALYHTKPGDVVVVDARGDMMSGVFGEMMLTFFKGRGGIGVVIDGCIRDYPNAKSLDLGMWLRGVTPNYHTQTNIYPHAVNIPIACGDVMVVPGDIILADDDGAVVIPAGLAGQIADSAGERHEWEEFTKLRLSQGGHLRDYYPLSEASKAEFEAWKRDQGH
ncbi:MAG: ribonuclease activity regulator RraA [Chloroflexi bacterium]|nr:ribonuclease activity regulator RraA [Chloroflexota bacterium]